MCERDGGVCVWGIGYVCGGHGVCVMGCVRVHVGRGVHACVCGGGHGGVCHGVCVRHGCVCVGGHGVCACVCMHRCTELLSSRALLSSSCLVQFLSPSPLYNFSAFWLQGQSSEHNFTPDRFSLKGIGQYCNVFYQCTEV